MFLVTRIKELKPKLPILMLYNGYDPTRSEGRWLIAQLGDTGGYAGHDRLHDA